ncbi:hypothetical protein Tco_0630520 [Tanacetum coccineum]
MALCSGISSHQSSKASHSSASKDMVPVELTQIFLGEIILHHIKVGNGSPARNNDCSSFQYAPLSWLAFVAPFLKVLDRFQSFSVEEPSEVHVESCQQDMVILRVEETWIDGVG